MKYSSQIEACFKAVFKDLGTDEQEWNAKYSVILSIVDIRDIETWVTILIDGGMSETDAFYRVQKFLDQKNVEYNQIQDERE